MRGISASAKSDEEFRDEAPSAGGFTAVPRWTLAPRPGTAGYETFVPGGLMAQLGELADEMGMPLGAVFLAAHAKVLAALSGEPEIATHYAGVPDGPALPCRLTTAGTTWRALLTEARQAVEQRPAAADAPVGTSHGRAEVPPRPVEFVCEGASGREPSGGGGASGDLEPHESRGPDDCAVLRVSLVRRGGEGVLRLRYRTEVLDEGCAARIAGYHRTALALMAAGPDAVHGRQSLLAEAELRLQQAEFTGPVRRLPDLRFHQLFEQRVRAHPDRTAVVYAPGHGDGPGQGHGQLTYRQLNARANRLAHALLARGLRPEGVVAVVAERTPDWMAAVLAVFKAGGVYLPVEPHLPADRIATMLTRAGCALVLTEPSSTATLDRAVAELPHIRTLFIDAACALHHDESDPGVPVARDALAYIFFTSGSTGEPKGAMCEHEGMLNHLYAKIDDLRIGEGQVVAQTAPQCFDISLWQLLAPLLTGGHTLLVEQAAILDVRRFLDAIAGGRAGVLQVVPSYLDVVLSALERHPRELPDLRCVSVTGEALKKELVERWFAAVPGVRLVNAYGLTETSDDTHHEVMDRVPDGDRVPLGRPVNNVRFRLVDDRLAPVPLGAPGEIVFSGVCVGRGYVNDPGRTQAAFPPDPHHAGQRLYRSGDFGRALPGGKLEFLGRRDAQVKIRGFRIETGEIESALLRVPGVRDAAVAASGQLGGTAQLVAFYTAGRPLAPDALRDRLARTLPPYMLPTAFHRRESLPLTANGKVDRKALSSLAATDGRTPQGSWVPPGSTTERRLAAVWAKALGVPERRIGRREDFFDLGGTSLSAVRVAIALDRAVSPKDLIRHPVLADLARLVDERAKTKGESDVDRSADLTTEP